MNQLKPFATLTLFLTRFETYVDYGGDGFHPPGFSQMQGFLDIVSYRNDIRKCRITFFIKKGPFLVFWYPFTTFLILYRKNLNLFLNVRYQILLKWVWGIRFWHMFKKFSFYGHFWFFWKKYLNFFWHNGHQFLLYWPCRIHFWHFWKILIF